MAIELRRWAERLERDRAVLQRLAIAYDACDKRLSQGTDYSVPTGSLRGAGPSTRWSSVADCQASYGKFVIRDYLSLLEQKTNALDQAAPLAGWLLPPVFGDLRPT